MESKLTLLCNNVICQTGNWTREDSTDSGNLSLSPCFLRQRLHLHHIFYPKQGSGNFVANTISGQPSWLHSGNQFSSFVSSKSHWHGVVGWGIFYWRFWEWLEKSEIYSIGQDCTLLNLLPDTNVPTIYRAILAKVNFLLAVSFCKALLPTKGFQSLSLSLSVISLSLLPVFLTFFYRTDTNLQFSSHLNLAYLFLSQNMLISPAKPTTI